MSRNEDIDNAIWSDPDFEDLSANATLLFLWSWTNPRCGMAGMYKVSHRAMTESKVSIDAMPATLTELAEAGFAFYEAQVLWVRARVKRLRSKSPQMAIAVSKDVQKIPVEHPLRVRFMEMYASHSWLREALSIAHREPTDNLSEKAVDKPNSHTLSQTSTEVLGKGKGTGGSSSEKVTLPDDFPDELRPHLKATFRILRSLAERHNAKSVNVVSLASVVMARPRKPLVRCAHDCAAHWDGRAQPVKDVVSAYRNWLDRADDLASTEAIDGATTPVSIRDERRARRAAAMDSIAQGDAA